jgi:hypothetical protein
VSQIDSHTITLVLTSFVTAKKAAIAQVLMQALKAAGTDTPIGDAVRLLDRLPRPLPAMRPDEAQALRSRLEDAGAFVATEGLDKPEGAARLRMRLASRSASGERVVYLSGQAVGVLSSTFRELELAVGAGTHQVELRTPGRALLGGSSRLSVAIAGDAPQTIDLLVTPPALLGGWTIAVE